MTPSPRSRRAVKVLVVLLLVPVLGAVAVYFWVQSLADRRWAEAEGRIRRLSIEYPPPPSRPQAEAMSEPAKEIQIHFVAAIREAARKRDLEPQARALLGRRKSGPDYDRLLGEAQDCLDRLHAGAREYAARPSEFPRGWGADWDPPTLAFLIYSSVLRSRRLRGDGAIFEAAQTNLDALHLVRFWASSGQGGGRIDALEIADHSLEELREILSQGRLTAGDLLSLERELETVDAALRSPLHDLAPALARWGEGLMELEVRPDEGFMKRAPYRWRFFLPKRLMKADAFEVIDRQVRELLACRDRSYLEVLDRLNLWWTEVEESKNPILHGHAFFGHDEGWVELDRKAKVRLLRVAARYRVRGEFLTLEDPFGGEVLHADSENRMKFWSRGMDGRDDGGSSRSDGRWKNSGSLGDPRVAQPPGDIVIQVERRAE